MRAPPVGIFVWDMHPDTSPADIVNDLAECGIQIEEKDVLKKSRDEAPLLSFKISVRAEDLQKALDPSIWPLRVKVREYIYYPKKKTNENNSNAENQPQRTEVPQLHVQPPTSSGSSDLLTPTNSPLTVSNRFNGLAGVDNISS